MWFKNHIILSGSVLRRSPAVTLKSNLPSVCLSLQRQELGRGWKERSSWQEKWLETLGETCHVMPQENAHYKMRLSHFTDQPNRGSSHPAKGSWLRLTNKGHVAFKIFSSWELERLLLLTQTIVQHSWNALSSCIYMFRNKIPTIRSTLKWLYAFLLIKMVTEAKGNPF